MRIRHLLAIGMAFAASGQTFAGAQDVCRLEGQDAGGAAQEYRAAVREVSSSCTKKGGDCVAARLHAGDVLNALLAAHQSLLNVCNNTTEPPPPPPAQAPTVPGDLVITEVNAQNADVIDWIEIFNPTSTAFDLLGLIISSSDGSENVTINAHVVVPAGGYSVLGRSDGVGFHSGFIVNYFFSGLVLGSEDDIQILNGTTSIDAVRWDGRYFPTTHFDVAISLDPGAFNWQSNDVITNWCAATTSMLVAGHGTPGAANPSCQ
jgi:Lamin Tail Domain